MEFKVGFIDKRGYRFVYMPNHPNVRKDGYIQEHRLVMEKHLGRFLKPKEVVHHLNHKKKFLIVIKNLFIKARKVNICDNI